MVWVLFNLPLRKQRRTHDFSRSVPAAMSGGMRSMFRFTPAWIVDQSCLFRMMMGQERLSDPSFRVTIPTSHAPTCLGSEQCRRQ
eukprot:487461-Amphidinium_carterae.1